MSREQQQAIEDSVEENRVVKTQLGGLRLWLADH